MSPTSAISRASGRGSDNDDMSEKVVHDANGTSCQDGFGDELDRIRSAYAKRGNSSLYSFWEPAYLLAVQERERKLLALLAAFGFAPRLPVTRILEVGCGSGFWLREFLRWGAQPENIFGIDLLPDRVAAAKRLCPPGVTVKCQSAENLQTLPAPFDLILQSTVFTSILAPEMKARIAREMLSGLDKDGAIIWYDFHMDNPANPDVQGIHRDEIAQLFPDCKIHLQRITLAPPIGRPVALASPTLYGALSRIKLLCSHYIGVVKKQ